MRLFRLPLALLAVLVPVAKAGETHIYIDQIPLYSSLASCAEDRLSAIVRAQSSGCGDNMQVTSFSCFCLGSSSLMSSIISTAVASNCAATGSASTARVTASAQVSSAMRVFNSYCARSTELPWFADNSTTMTITAAPSTVSIPTTDATPSATSPPSSSGSSVPVAAIAAPVVIGVVAIAGVVGLLFWLRRRRNARQAQEKGTDEALPPNYYQPPGEMDASAPPRELGDAKIAHEIQGSAVKYRHELGVNAVELDSSPIAAGVENSRTDGKSSEGKS